MRARGAPGGRGDLEIARDAAPGRAPAVPPEALAAIPETMATVYKVLPLTAKDGVATVTISDPMSLPGLDDLKNMGDSEN